MSTLTKKIKITTTLELITGLHIGGSKDSVEIGGIDTPVIKIATKENQPYIPGSSLKGKIRCLLEQIAGTELCGNDDVNNLFGCTGKDKDKDNKPSKIIVRDAYLQTDSVTLLKNCDSLDMPFTESKYENVIDRIKGTAEHPRQIERIPAGVKFDVEFVINIWEGDNENSLVELLKKGIHALENDYLGGNGTRGYGQIKFGELIHSEISETTNWKYNENSSSNL